MQQNWNIKSRSHECSRSGRPFEEGEVFHTSIYFDTESGEFVRRDVGLDAWDEEVKERTPLAYWRTTYVKPDSGKPKVEMSTKESAESLLRRLIDEDEEHTENARYILGLMLERKKQLVPKESKYTEQGTLLLYEHRKSGEVFIIRDPELRLDEIASMQEEVATLLGFGGPVVEAAKVAGVTLTADGKIEKKGKAEKSEPQEAQLNLEPAVSENTAATSEPESAAAEPAAEAGAETEAEAEAAEGADELADEASVETEEDESTEVESEADEDTEEEFETDDSSEEDAPSSDESEPESEGDAAESEEEEEQTDSK